MPWLRLQLQGQPKGPGKMGMAEMPWEWEAMGGTYRGT